MSNPCPPYVRALSRMLAMLSMAVLITWTLAGCGGAGTQIAHDEGGGFSGPVVTGVAPASGPATGGTVVILTGSGFTGATAVTFAPGIGASVAAVSFTVDSDSQITATTPAASFSALPAVTNVRVTTPSGTSQDTAAAQFTFQSAVAVTGVAPTSGPASGGTVVVITGSGFTGATGVFFAPTTGAEVAAAAFTVDSDTQITATTPATSFAVLPATTNVRVTTPRGSSPDAAAAEFTFEPVFALDPPTGPVAGGTVVTITGSGFTGATAVKFGTVDAAAFTVVSDNEITATSPPGTLTVDVTVTTPQGTTVPTNPGSKFTYVVPANFFAFNSVPGTTLRGAEVNSNFTFAILPGDAGVIVKASGAVTTVQLPSPTAENLRAVTQNSSNVFILVGDNGTIVTSNAVASVADAIVWTVRASPTTNHLFGVERDATSQVAVGAGGTIIRSTDPTAAWTLQASGVTADLFAVTFGGGQFVAVGAQGTVLTSPDGITWTTRTSSTTRNLRGVNVYVANATTTIIAVGDGGTIITSTDGGATWTTQISGTTANLHAVGNTGSKVIAVGDGGLALVSPTGIGWAPSTTNTTQNLYGADSKPGLVFVGGAEGTVIGGN